MPLTLAPPPLTREDALSRRLDEVAGRLRRVVLLRAGSWLVVVSVLFVCGIALLDQRFQLPPLVRGLGLVAYLVSLPLLVRRWVLQPLDGAADPVRVAQRIERAYPDFNDSLVSAVQFIRQDSGDRTSSPGLRKAAIRRASRKAERHDLDRAVDSRWVKRSVLAALVAMGVSGWLVYTAPDAAVAEVKRIALPFGGTAAPTQTKIEILAPGPAAFASPDGARRAARYQARPARCDPGPGPGVGQTGRITGGRSELCGHVRRGHAGRGRTHGANRADTHPPRLPVPRPGERPRHRVADGARLAPARACPARRPAVAADPARLPGLHRSSRGRLARRRWVDRVRGRHPRYLASRDRPACHPRLDRVPPGPARPPARPSPGDARG